jgi:hypothetical protein
MASLSNSELDSFKELMEERDKRYSQRADSQDKAVATALATSKEAILKAETATDKRLEGLNELKGMAQDQAATFARISEVNLRFDAVNKTVEQLSDTIKQKVAATSGMKELWGYIVGAVGVLLAVAAIISPHLFK